MDVSWIIAEEDKVGCFLENLCRLGIPLNEVDDDGSYVSFAVMLIFC